jgi:hypothetical protein
MKIYIEYQALSDRENIIAEISLDKNFYEKLDKEDRFGKYLQDTYDLEIIQGWEVFNESFTERLYSLLVQTFKDKNKIADFLKVCQELKDYLFKFPYNERIEFLTKMFSLLYKAYNQGGNFVLNQINSAIDKEKFGEFEKSSYLCGNKKIVKMSKNCKFVRTVGLQNLEGYHIKVKCSTCGIEAIYFQENENDIRLFNPITNEYDIKVDSTTVCEGQKYLDDKKKSDALKSIQIRKGSTVKTNDFIGKIIKYNSNVDIWIEAHNGPQPIKKEQIIELIEY